MNYYSISEAAARFHIPESTIRYYEKKGLLPLMERDEAGRRLFSPNQMTMLEIIIYLKNTRMPIRTIKQYVDLVMEGDHTTPLRLEMMRKHKQAVLDEMALMSESLAGIEKKIARYTKRLQDKKQVVHEEAGATASTKSIRKEEP
ncbi:MerR family transcriptional regulator [Paenibacillus sp. HB172176]|uniref:MerR family transcriptional regulator n=1 Tax=Paenibacillus sp. HB172176 TaxID=2493690 RepID=UPI00143C936A|nr:MerR family transcriptional regulator [Paenibacillus sp. HB172176]